MWGCLYRDESLNHIKQIRVGKCMDEILNHINKINCVDIGIRAWTMLNKFVWSFPFNLMVLPFVLWSVFLSIYVCFFPIVVSKLDDSCNLVTKQEKGIEEAWGRWCGSIRNHCVESLLDDVIVKWRVPIEVVNSTSFEVSPSKICGA